SSARRASVLDASAGVVDLSLHEVPEPVVRLSLDENLPYRVAAAARARGVDATSSYECDRNGLSDEQQLRLAGEEGRCFVTRNARHFVPLTTRFLENRWPHAGLLLVPASIANSDVGGLV